MRDKREEMHLPPPRHARLFRPPQSLLGFQRRLGSTRFFFGAQPFFVLIVLLFFLYVKPQALLRFS